MGDSIRFKPYKAFAFRDELHIPKGLAEHKDIPWSAKGIYGALLDHVSRDSTCVWPTLERLGDMTGMAFNSVSKQLKTLADYGLIERVPEGKKTLTFFLWNETILGQKPEDLEVVPYGLNLPQGEALSGSNLPHREGQPSPGGSEPSPQGSQPSPGGRNNNKGTIHVHEHAQEEREYDPDSKNEIELIQHLVPLGGKFSAQDRYDRWLRIAYPEDILRLLREAVKTGKGIKWVGDQLNARHNAQMQQSKSHRPGSKSTAVGKWGYGT